MEIIIGFVVVIGLLVLLGVNPFYIMEGIYILMLLLLAATVLFFVITAVSLIGSKKRSAVFVRIDKPEKKAFPSAVYLSDGEELRNSFPNEFVLKKLLYRKDKNVILRVTKRGGVYDKYSFVTVIAGLILGGISLFLLSWSFSTFF